MSEELYTLVIDGKEIQAPANSSIIQALARAGKAITANVGCMGQGVCGSCLGAQRRRAQSGNQIGLRNQN